MVGKDLVGTSCVYMGKHWIIDGISKNMSGTFFTIRKEKKKLVVRRDEVEIIEGRK